MKISKEVKIGAIALLVLALSAWGFNFLKGKNIFKRTNNYFAVYDDVGGLITSNPVLISGLKVGQVLDIEFTSNISRKLIVEFSIEGNIKIPKNSVAQIFNSSIMGTKAMQILFTDSTTYHKHGDTLLSSVELSLQEQMDPLKNQIEELINNLDMIVKTAVGILNDTVQEQILNSISSVEDISASLSRQLGENGRFEQILAHVQSISNNLENHNEQISNVLNNLSAVSDSLERAHIKRTIENADIAITGVNTLVQKINRGEGSVGLLVNNDSLYYYLESSARDLDKLIIDLEQNPKKYVHFSIFGKKNKESKQK